MSNWAHTLLVIVPEVLIQEANKLALAIGTSEDDVNTFRSADWTDGANSFSVANTQAVEQIMDYFNGVTADAGSPLADALAATMFPSMSIDADGMATWAGIDKTKIQVFVDQEPFHVLSILGLARHEHY